MLPPALAWLWRLVAPRGHENPSIVETEGMSSEGVGSYWPFPEEFLHADTQPEVGEGAYDQGALMLRNFFLQCLAGFMKPNLAPLGKEIITCRMDNGTVEQSDEDVRMQWPKAR